MGACPVRKEREELEPEVKRTQAEKEQQSQSWLLTKGQRRVCRSRGLVVPQRAQSGAGTGALELLEGLAQPPSSVLPILTLGWWAWQCGREGEAVPLWFAPA